MKFLAVSALLLQVVPLTTALPANEIRQEETYDYIVVGSGAGGGPLASRLARAGHKTLLIEAGDDQSGNSNTTVPIFQTLVSGDPQIRWDYYVTHYKDQARARKDPKYVYDIGNGEVYTGLTPPAGAKDLGILYPRAGTLGGCVTHNALIYITAHDSDWNGIAALTDDESWTASNMKQYLKKVEEWQPVEPTDPTILLRDLQLVQQLAGGASVATPGAIDLLKPVVGLGNALLNDPNLDVPGRDSKQGLYPIPLTMDKGTRKGVREHIKDTVASGFPLTVRTNTFVTKLDLDTSGATPRAVGVEYLYGNNLYRASPLSGGAGTSGSAKASKEVILSGGAYNTVQLLKLSGIGPRAELESFDIPVIVDSPGIGTNLQDRYEVGLNVAHDKDFPILDGCTLDAKEHDKCYKQWVNGPPILAQRGTYATNGLAATMIKRSDFAANTDVDMFIFASPANFTGYYPKWYDGVLQNHHSFSWYTLKAHTRNHAGTVTLRSADPLDPPQIDFNYFDTGTTENGADQADLNAMIQALKISRQALQKYNQLPLSLLGGSKFKEISPGPEVTTDEGLGEYIKSRAWGHHACGTVPIGADADQNTPLDSKFRVKGVDGLRVVDASVFPKIPGVFITAPIIVMSEKAAAVILEDA
ncbi:Putative glucose-methanol-choline oxidoreductase, FAD/NAD(P)-binding domain superfamily [Septoria linicola]|uniref:Glucose-methanol-choline oxidoreductase, FAD/NAD(P)-binding domain superfamily n=1 Tax=Septoria linicola TaxID=215465 RepID=A0A9Q9EI13_9PEZI|nr:Putative glucose-methanol-choline oxidoreductase, FAD/NAD(P)-binding domain superfamily [Septoria linicola]